MKYHNTNVCLPMLNIWYIKELNWNTYAAIGSSSLIGLVLLINQHTDFVSGFPGPLKTSLSGNTQKKTKRKKLFSILRLSGYVLARRFCEPMISLCFQYMIDAIKIIRYYYRKLHTSLILLLFSNSVKHFYFFYSCFKF